MKRLLLLVLCCGCGLVLFPSRPYRVCKRNFEKEYAEEIAACRELNRQRDACFDAIPQISETHPYFREEDIDRCSRKFPTANRCYPQSPCEHLYDGLSL